MKLRIVSCLTSLVVLLTSCGQTTGPRSETGDADAARRLASDRRVRTINVDPILPALLRIVDREDAVSTDVAASRAVELLARHFTAAQIEALTRFHESPEGQAILRKHVQEREAETPSENASDDLLSRRESARRFMTTFQMERFYGAYIRGVMAPSGNRPESIEKAIRAWYEEVFAPLEFEREVHVYTRRELDALTKFFSTRDGEAIAARAGAFAADLMKTLGALGK
jgi:hypothetical protein